MKTTGSWKATGPWTEDDLIAYHLGDLPRLQRWKLRRALEADPELAAESESIAVTLRAFDGGPAPAVTSALLDCAWSQVRPSMAVLPSQERGLLPVRPSVRWATMGAGALAALVVALLLLHQAPRPADGVATVPARSPLMAGADKVLARLHSKRKDVQPFNGRPGPLTTMPVDAVAGDPAMGAYLESAERLLTEVSHEQGPPSFETRNQVHRMLLQNAVYQRSAQDHGDLAAAGVMDDLGRVLVSLDAEPPESAHSADAFRVQMNLGSILFDLRILHSGPVSQRSARAE